MKPTAVLYTVLVVAFILILGTFALDMVINHPQETLAIIQRLREMPASGFMP